jgi:hypothetical protein
MDGIEKRNERGKQSKKGDEKKREEETVMTFI